MFVKKELDIVARQMDKPKNPKIKANSWLVLQEGSLEVLNYFVAVLILVIGPCQISQNTRAR